MKKKIECLALFAVFALGVSLPHVQATTDEYVSASENLSFGGLEDESLPPGYELDIEETDQPFIAHESFLAEEEELEGILEVEEQGKEAHYMTGTSFLEDK